MAERRDLELLVAIEGHGGVDRAAEAVRLTHGAAWKGVARLEKEAGFPLVHRHAKTPNVLTREGTVLARKAAATVEAHRAYEGTAQALRSEPEGDHPE